MKKSLTRFREGGSFIAGILVGLSIVVPVIALTGASPTDWQTFLLFGAPMILVLGITLQAVITAKHRHQRTINTAPQQSQDGLLQSYYNVTPYWHPETVTPYWHPETITPTKQRVASSTPALGAQAVAGEELVISI